MRNEDPEVMTLQFYAPIYLLLTMCDREPAREEEALVYLERHIRQFQSMGMMQKGGMGSSPMEKEYWENNGWLGTKRPWKIVR